MKRNLWYFLISIFAFISFSTATFAQKETFILDDQHTYVLWSIKHFGFSNQVGKWYASGQLTLDKEHPEQSEVNATIKLADISTGLSELDKHLKDASFFNVDQFPKATFVSTKVDVLSHNKAKVYGKLTLHGVTKTVILDVTLNKAGIHPVSKKKAVGFMATTNIKRSDFGMNSYLPDLGDEVLLQIGAEAFQDNNQENDKQSK